ncbi:MAG TPA: ABC transporter permease [Jatrophihabitans sp.]|uniref:ABC transporter permease n=1 Tax=Jatrophihabitans sp. TaxID=1932789 RepID=UPI002E0656CB|nr:ABC transporter permease [Jatrophihabitans sp.]
MIRLIRAEFLKLRTTQVWFWLLLATAGLSVLLVVGGIAPRDGVRTARQVPDLFASFAASGPGYILVFVLGVLGVTTEFRYQTITPTFLQTPSRWAVTTAKMITYAVLGVGYALVALIAQLAVALPWLSARNISVDFGNSQIQHAIIGGFGVIALFGIVGLGFGALVRNQIVAVVVGIIFLLIIENVLLAIPVVRKAWPFTPNGGVQAILHTTGTTEVVDGVHLLPLGGGIVVLLLWAFVPAIIGAAYSMNRDIT